MNPQDPTSTASIAPMTPSVSSTPNFNSSPITPSTPAAPAPQTPTNTSNSNTPYNYQGAISAGANPSDVINYLAKQTGYNAQGALSAGANPMDVLRYMSNLPRTAQTPTQTSTPTQKSGGLFSGIPVVGGIMDSLTSSEQGFGKDIGTAINENMPGVADAQSNAVAASAQASHLNGLLIQKQHQMKAAGQDTTAIDSVIADNNKLLGTGGGANAADIYSNVPTTGKVLGDAGGVALDALSAGNYSGIGEDINALKAGDYAKAAEGTGTLVSKGATQTATQVGKQGLGQTLKDIGIKTAEHSAVGAGVGYGYDVSQNLQNGKTGTAAFAPGMGTAAGAIIPLGIGGLQAGAAITADQAPRIINSLVKPNAASFAYGKNPGRTVSELGITGNNLEDFAHNIGTAKNDIGSQIGAIYSAPENAAVRIDATPTINKLDTAMAEAAKGGKNNQAIVTQLQNVKDAIMHDHGIDGEGNIVRINSTPHDLSALNPQQAFDLKSKIASLTRFTGNASDDKAVNSTLKSMYGNLSDALTSSVKGNNPELDKLNQQYSDLTSAELATTNRNAIVQRSNMIGMPIKVGGAAGIITAIGTGGAAIPAILAGAGAAGLDKALQSTAVKTRVAAWLGKESPNVIQRVLEQNPSIRTVLYRALPKFAAQLGQPSPTP